MFPPLSVLRKEARPVLRAGLDLDATLALHVEHGGPERIRHRGVDLGHDPRPVVGVVDGQELRAATSSRDVSSPRYAPSRYAEDRDSGASVQRGHGAVRSGALRRSPRRQCATVLSGMPVNRGDVAGHRARNAEGKYAFYGFTRMHGRSVSGATDSFRLIVPSVGFEPTLYAV